MRTVDESRCVVVYDGNCAFCRRQIEWLRKNDRAGRLAFVSRHADGVLERFPRLAEGDFNTGLRAVLPDGSIHVGADGVYQIARRLTGYRAVAWLYRVPGLRGLCRLAYACVARNRYRLARSCDDGVCVAPEAGPSKRT